MPARAETVPLLPSSHAAARVTMAAAGQSHVQAYVHRGVVVAIMRASWRIADTLIAGHTVKIAISHATKPHRQFLAVSTPLRGQWAFRRRSRSKSESIVDVNAPYILDKMMVNPNSCCRE